MPVIVDLEQFIREKEAEWKRNITWREISEETGLSESTLSRVIHSAKRPDLETIGKLCKFFNIPPGPVPFIRWEPD